MSCRGCPKNRFMNEGTEKKSPECSSELEKKLAEMKKEREEWMKAHPHEKEHWNKPMSN